MFVHILFYHFPPYFFNFLLSFCLFCWLLLMSFWYVVLKKYPVLFFCDGIKNIDALESCALLWYLTLTLLYFSFREKFVSSWQRRPKLGNWKLWMGPLLLKLVPSVSVAGTKQLTKPPLMLHQKRCQVGTRLTPLLRYDSYFSTLTDFDRLSAHMYIGFCRYLVVENVYFRNQSHSSHVKVLYCFFLFMLFVYAVDSRTHPSTHTFKQSMGWNPRPS